MTDDLMDARLRAAGEKWRAANTAEADVADSATEHLDLDMQHSPHRARWVTIASAAVVAAALVIGGVVFARSGDHNHRTTGVESSPVSELAGVTWTDRNSTGTVVFAPGTARTFDGCSNALYRLTIDHTALGIGKQLGDASTCAGTAEPPPGPARVAYDRAAANLAKFYRVLRGPAQWSLSGTTLTLTVAGGASVTLVNDGKRAPSLVGTSWVLERVVDASGHDLPGSFSSATLSLTPDGKFTANDLCNTLSGTATSTADTVDFGQVATTEIGCLDPGFTPATAVIDKVLTGTASYGIRGQQMMISKKGYGGLLIYVRSPATSTNDDLLNLVSRPWTLTGTETMTSDARSSSGSVSSAVSLSVLEFDGNVGFTVRHRCYTDEGRVDLGAGTASLTGVKLKLAIPCASGAESAAGQKENDFVDSLLMGHVTWTIDGNQLTITDDQRRHAAIFARAGDLEALLEDQWTLTTIESGTGPDAPASMPSAAIDFSFGQDSVAGAGNARPATVFAGGITFRGSWINDATAGVHLSQTEDDVVFGKILDGAVVWSIRGDQLTITKAGVGALVFTKKA